MARLLSFLMMLTLAMTQGSSMAAAVCRHQNAQEHILARQSSDVKVAAVSLHEEAAAAVASKKAPQAPGGASHWPAELIPPSTGSFPLRVVERVRLRPSVQAGLPSATVAPLLKPPSA